MPPLARLVAALALAAALAEPVAAQRLEPPSTGGIAALDRVLRQLGHDKRVLVIGAHPDDEDTELLTVLTRGEGAAAAYLSLTRGEGGQNLIGPELGDALGLLRTEELLAARELDGARQYFTRAYDFGYTKTLDDTWAHWPRDSVLKDVVRIVRRFRPQVIVSIFSGTSRDGHGQHQAAGWAAHEAFAAAADPARFPELAREEGLAPWRPSKLYRSTRFDTAATTLALDGGVLDPAEGRSFHQIAMRSRSLHQSQDMGQLQRIGPSAVRLALVEDRTGAGDTGFFDGVNTMPAALARYAALADSARSVAGPATLAEVRRLLTTAREALIAGAGPDRDAANLAATTVGEQLALLDQAMAAAGQVVVDALTLDDRIAAGEPVAMALRAMNGSPDTVVVAPRIAAAWNGDTTLLRLASRRLAPGDTAGWNVEISVPADAHPTVPYFVRPEGKALYDVRQDAAPVIRGRPFAPAPLTAVFDVTPPRGWTYAVHREAAFRFNDQATGEVRRPVTIVPKLQVLVEPAAELWAAGDTAARPVRVTVVNASRDSVRGQVRFELPGGWPAVSPVAFALGGQDDRRTYEVNVRPPRRLGGGVYRLRAVAVTAEREEYRTGLAAITYPHIRTRTWSVPAELVVTAAPLAMPALRRVGYVRGAADRVPEALRAVGVPLEILDAASLARADLAAYDAIVVGPRAYEVDSAVIEHNRRLLAYAERGGLVIVQYQQHAFFEGGFAPYPLELAPRHDRVTDEMAAVTVLAPSHAAMRAPNPIGPSDWEGWVQERGLYFARRWDDRYVPLLAMGDPGEAPVRGGLLVAPIGEGTWVYTGLSFFRQLPAGVPGAYRLFANLLGLARERPGRSAP